MEIFVRRRPCIYMFFGLEADQC